jgi:hypothetical protein
MPSFVCSGWKLKSILNTHHHDDHTGGNKQLKALYGCTIIGPKADQARIPLIDTALTEGESFHLGEIEFKVLDTPGHTRGHITFWAPSASAVFPGDTLFAMGCGRLFEGTPEQMWASLSKLKALPKETEVFCAHEYTLSNAKCASSFLAGLFGVVALSVPSHHCPGPCVPLPCPLPCLTFQPARIFGHLMSADDVAFVPSLTSHMASRDVQCHTVIVSPVSCLSVVTA